jgi:hypothetical protein
MNRATKLALILCAGCLSSCAEGEVAPRADSISDIEKILDVEICDGTILGAVDERPRPIGDIELHILNFPSESCVEKFYRDMEAGSAEYGTVDDKDYSRSVGARGTPSELFVINRLSDSSVTVGLQNKPI